MGIKEKIDAVNHIPATHRFPSIPAPKSVKIELTGRCNFKCNFCARADHLRSQQEMDWDMLDRLLHEMYDAGVEEIGMFYLGESFMDKRLADAIKLAKDIGFPYVFLTTNGSISTPEKVEGVFRAGLDSLKFSLNYADEEQFVEIAQVKGKMYHAMLKNMKAAKEVRDTVEAETGHRCGLYASYIEYNGDQGDRMKAVADEMGEYVDEMYALPLYGQAGPQDSPLIASLKEGKMKPTGGNTGRKDNPVPALPCWAVFNEGHITWDGKMSACGWDHADGLTMGHVTEMSFMDAWNSEKFQALRAKHLSEDVHGTACEVCIYRTSVV